MVKINHIFCGTYDMFCGDSVPSIPRGDPVKHKMNKLRGQILFK